MNATSPLSPDNVWRLLDVLASYRLSWTLIAQGDRKERAPLRLIVTILRLRILVEIDSGILYLTFYRGNEDVLDDPSTLLEYLRDASKAAKRAPRSLLDLVETVRSLRDAPRVLEQHRDDTVMLTFITPNTLVELDFFDDHIEYSIFAKEAAPARWEDFLEEVERYVAD